MWAFNRNACMHTDIEGCGDLRCWVTCKYDLLPVSLSCTGPLSVVIRLASVCDCVCVLYVWWVCSLRRRWFYIEQLCAFMCICSIGWWWVRELALLVSNATRVSTLVFIGYLLFSYYSELCMCLPIVCVCVVCVCVRARARVRACIYFYWLHE